jgi:hypothetical protein
MNSIHNDQKKQSKLGCSLVIDTEEEPPGMLDSMLGVSASAYQIKGTQKTNKKGVLIPDVFYQFNLWILKSEPLYGNDTVYLNHAVEGFLKVLDARKEAFINILDKYQNSYLFCYAYFREVNPYFSMDRGLLKKLCEYNLRVDFDIYCLKAEEV